MCSGEMLDRIENRSGETPGRDEERLGWKARMVVPVPARGWELRTGPGSGAEGLRLPEREEDPFGRKEREVPCTGCSSWSEGLWLPERGEGFLDECFERVIGIWFVVTRSRY